MAYFEEKKAPPSSLSPIDNELEKLQAAYLAEEVLTEEDFENYSLTALGYAASFRKEPPPHE